MTCKVCGGSMSVNEKKRPGTKAPDYICNQDNGECLTNGYPSGAWKPKQKSTGTMFTPKEDTGTPVTAVSPVKESVWESKDRQSAAQTALKFAGDLFQGTEKVEEAKELAKWAFHEFIRPAYRGTIMKEPYPMEPAGSSKTYKKPLTDEQEEEINLDSIE